MEFKDLIGTHKLSGVDYGHTPENSNTVDFVLDGDIYSAIEDPEDGYRSSMKDIAKGRISEVKNTFPPISILIRERDIDRDGEVLDFVDIKNGKTVLSIGTNETDFWYPYFVGEFFPENMSINTESGGIGVEMEKEKQNINEYKYYDEDNNERSLYWMVKNRPGWAHSRLAFYRLEYDKQTAEIAALKEDRDLWKKSEGECNEYSKELLDQIETLKAKIDKLQDRLSSGRDYLMGVEPEFLSAEDALESFGYGRNGLNS